MSEGFWFNRWLFIALYVLFLLRTIFAFYIYVNVSTISISFRFDIVTINIVISFPLFKEKEGSFSMKSKTDRVNSHYLVFTLAFFWVIFCLIFIFSPIREGGGFHIKLTESILFVICVCQSRSICHSKNTPLFVNSIMCT